jgi:hypothetical protein
MLADAGILVCCETLLATFVGFLLGIASERRAFRATRIPTISAAETATAAQVRTQFHLGVVSSAIRARTPASNDAGTS